MTKSDLYYRVTRLAAARDSNATQALLRYREELSSSEFQECLGNISFYKGEYQEAVQHYEDAILGTEGYSCARYHYLLGVQDERAAELSDAFSRYQASIEVEPQFVDAYVELGGLLCKVREWEGALTCYVDAIAIDPDDLTTRHNLVQVLSQLAKRDSETYQARLMEAQENLRLAQARLPPIEAGHIW